jgi:2-methylcitrate dehydratase PrpD
VSGETLLHRRMGECGLDRRHVAAFVDWLACVFAGAGERAARCAASAVDGLGGRVLAAGTAGHVLDFDDTYAPGLAHLSAPTAPAALVLGAELDATVGDVLAGHAAGFEAMGALARASHPALYERGWHPTAVCGAVGAAVSAARLLGAGAEAADTATRLALVRAGGLRRAFGSDAKALQVGAAAAAGVTAARLAVAGATATQDLATGPGGFEQAFGGRWARPDGEAAVAENWIKAYPCCLQTHSPIEAAQTARATAGAEAAPVTVVVHPRARQAAPYDDVEDGLQAKFSIPYTVAYTLLYGVPSAPSCFSALDEAARALAREHVRVRVDEALPETGAQLELGGEPVAKVETATGSPSRPMTDEQLAAKVSTLGATHLTSMLESPDAPARDLAAAALEGLWEGRIS